MRSILEADKYLSMLHILKGTNNHRFSKHLLSIFRLGIKQANRNDFHEHAGIAFCNRFFIKSYYLKFSTHITKRLKTSLEV